MQRQQCTTRAPRALLRALNTPERKMLNLTKYFVRYEASVPLEAVLPLEAEAKRVETKVSSHGAVQVGWRVHAWQPETTVRGMSLDGAWGSRGCAHVCAESLHGASHCSRAR